MRSIAEGGGHHETDPRLGVNREAPDEGALAALGQTAVGVAHDFDNALTAIVSHATLIRGRSSEPDTVANAEAILRACRGASEVIERIRGALRPSAPHERVRLSLGALLDEARAAASVRAAARGVRLTSALDRAEPADADDLVAGHPGELHQAIVNLIHNAIDAASRHVELGLAGDAGAVWVTIEDDGPGIPEALREAVFTPFFTTRSGGTGLGLQLARATATAHGGELRLEPRAPTGTRAVLALPRLMEAEAVAPPRPLTDVDLQPTGHGATVLVVDDDESTREALGILLATAGYRVLGASSTREALLAFHAQRPDLVVTDLQLGASSAVGFIDRLSALDPTLPIVVATGLVESERPERLGRRVAAIFDKPVSPGRLLDTLRRLIAERLTLSQQRGRHE